MRKKNRNEIANQAIEEQLTEKPTKENIKKILLIILKTKDVGLITTFLVFHTGEGSSFTNLDMVSHMTMHLSYVIRLAVMATWLESRQDAISLLPDLENSFDIFFFSFFLLCVLCSYSHYLKPKHQKHQNTKTPKQQNNKTTKHQNTKTPKHQNTVWILQWKG